MKGIFKLFSNFKNRSIKYKIVTIQILLLIVLIKNVFADVFEFIYESKHQNYNFYFENCSNEIKDKTKDIYYIKLPMVLWGKGYSSSNKRILFCYEDKKYKYNQIKTYNYNQGISNPAHSICNNFFSKETNKYRIYLLSKQKIEEKNIFIGLEQKSGGNIFPIKSFNKNDLPTGDKKEFKAFLFNGQTNRKIQTNGPCFDDEGYTYFVLKNYDCETLKNEFLNKQNNTTDQKYNNVGKILDYKIFNNFGAVHLNKSLQTNDNINNLKYVLLLTNDWISNISPILIKENKLFFYQNNNISNADYYFFLNQDMDLEYYINSYGGINYYNKYSFLCAKDQKTNYETKWKESIESLKFFQSIIQNDQYNNYITNIERHKPNLENASYSFAGIKNNQGSLVPFENFYLQKVNKYWILKDYKYNKDPINLILPNKKKQSEDNVDTYWNEEINYIKTNIYDSQDFYFFEIIESNIVPAQEYISDKFPRNRIIQKQIKNWIILDGYNKSNLLNNYRSQKTAKEFFNKSQRFSLMNGSNLKHYNNLSRLDYRSVTADFINAFLNLNETVQGRETWEMHIIVDFQVNRTIDDSTITSLINKLNELNIIRLHFWEFAPNQVYSFYAYLSERLSKKKVKSKHSFIRNSNEFEYPNNKINMMLP